MEEIWKAAVGYEDYYEVSNLGRVRRIKGGMGAVINRVLSPLVNPDGYRQVVFHNDVGRKTYSVSRIVYAAFVGEIPNGLEINHKNFDRADNRVENLEVMSHGDNVRYSVKAGKFIGRRCVSGEAHGRAKLTEDQVREIRRSYHNGEKNQRELSLEFGVCQANIQLIVRNKKWKSLLCA